MLLSGSKSYYDDYLRKKDTSRTLHDPPSLLTDRGAYVNFLEVQLERVSAACLGVQAYDDRFHDMQQQIISLEQRHISTTRLLALNQQCTEELRKIVDEKISRVTEELRSENWNFRQLVETMSTRISSVEVVMADKVPGLQRELDIARETIAETKADLADLTHALKRNLEQSQSKFSSIEEHSTEMLRSISKLETADSKIQFELEESTSKCRQLIQMTEKRLQESLQESRDLQSRQLHSFSVKLSEQIDKLQVDVISKEAGCLAAGRLLGDNLRDDFKKIQSGFREELHEMEKRWTEGLEDEMEKVRNRFMEHIVILSSGLDTQRVAHQTATDNTKLQFHQFDQVMTSLSSDQTELLRTTGQLKHSIEQVLVSSPSGSSQSSPRDMREPPRELRERESDQPHQRRDWQPRDQSDRPEHLPRVEFSDQKRDLRDQPKDQPPRVSEQERDSHRRREEENTCPNPRSQSTGGRGPGEGRGRENVPPNRNRSSYEEGERGREGRDRDTQWPSQQSVQEPKKGPRKCPSPVRWEEGGAEREEREPFFEESPIPRPRPRDISSQALHRGRLKTPVTISRSPESRGDECTERKRLRDEYIDYLGGGLYCDGGEAQEEASHSRAVALGLTYIGRGLYVDPGGALGRDNYNPLVSSSERPRKHSPSRRAPLPPQVASTREGKLLPQTPTPSLSSSPEQMVALFEKFLAKHRPATDRELEQDR
jgi:hypothetical protein